MSWTTQSVKSMSYNRTDYRLSVRLLLQLNVKWVESKKLSYDDIYVFCSHCIYSVHTVDIISTLLKCLIWLRLYCMLTSYYFYWYLFLTVLFSPATHQISELRDLSYIISSHLNSIYRKRLKNYIIILGAGIERLGWICLDQSDFGSAGSFTVTLPPPLTLLCVLLSLLLSNEG